MNAWKRILNDSLFLDVQEALKKILLIAITRKK